MSRSLEASKRRRMLPRPACRRQGCPNLVPYGNAWYCSRRCDVKDKELARHHELHAMGVKGGAAGWKPGGKNRANYVARIRAKVQALVPAQETFTRDEVLLLVYRGRVQGYHTGARMAAMRAQRQMQALKQEIAHERYHRLMRRPA